MPNVTLRAVLTGTSAGMVRAFNEGADSAEKAAARIAASATRAQAQQDATFRKMGAAASITGVAIGAAFYGAEKSIMGFDKKLSNVAAVSDATASQMNQLRDAAIAAGANTKLAGVSASEAAQSEAELVKAGVSVNDLLGGALVGSLSLASAGQLDFADAARIAATAMTQFGLTGADVPHIADLLAAAANKAQGEVVDMGAAFNFVGPLAHQMGVSIEETAGTIALMARNGIIGEQAGTGLRGMLLSLTAPSKEAADLMSQLGISVYDAQGNFVGFNGVADQLRQGLSNMSNAQRDAAFGTLFGNRQIIEARVLYAGGAAAVDAWTRKVNDQGAAARMAAEQMDNLSGDLENLGGAIEAAILKNGSSVTGVLRFMAQSATDTISAFTALPGPVQTAATALTGVTLAGTALGAMAIVAVPRIHAFNLALLELATNPATSSGATTALVGLSGAVRGVGSALSYAVPIAGTAFVTFQALNAVFGGDKSVGKSMDNLRTAFTGTAGALDNTTRAAMAAHVETLGMTNAFATAGVSVDDLYAAAQHGMEGVTAFGRSLYEAGAISKTQLQALGGFANALEYGAAKGKDIKAVLGDTGAAFDALAPPVDDAADALKAYSDALDTLYSSTFSIQEATNKYTADLIGFADGVRAAQVEGDKFAASLDGSTESGIKNQDALAGIVREALDVADAMTRQGKGTDEVGAKMGEYRAVLGTVLEQLGFNTQQAQIYIDTLLKVPGTVSTTINLDTAAAQAKLAALFNTLGNLDFNLRAIGERVIGSGSAAMPTSLRAPTSGLSGDLAKAVRGGGSQATQARQSASSGGGSSSAKTPPQDHTLDIVKQFIDASLSAGNDELSSLKSAAGSDRSVDVKAAITGPALAKFNDMVAALSKIHTKATDDLVVQLKATFKQAQDQLASDLMVEQANAHTELLKRQADALADQTTAVEDAAKAQTQAVTDAANIMSVSMQAAAGAISDAARVTSDRMSASAQAIIDATTTAHDDAQARAQAIMDASQIVVDKIAMQGLYGMNLVAQQQTVALDEMRQGFNQQIAAAQHSINVVTADNHATVAQAQSALDQAVAIQNSLVSQAQAQNAVVAQQSNAMIAGQQAQFDQVQAQTNRQVEWAAGQAAYSAEKGTKQQAAEAAAKLAQAQAQQQLIVGQASAALSAAQSAAAAQQAQAQAALQSAQDQANSIKAAADAALQAAQGNAAIVIAQAQQALSQASDNAAVAEAQQQALINETRAKAQQQFGGGGLVVNITGIDPTNATAIASELSWIHRTQISNAG